MIYILTGAIQSGKTTRLMEWVLKKRDVYGIVTPVINGARIFMDVHTKEPFEMEASEKSEHALHVGKYVFNKTSFERAAKIIRQGVQKKYGWIIIDEIGPLELKHEGLYDVVKEIIALENNKMDVLLVIRESILEKAIAFFKLNPNNINIIRAGDDFFKR